MRWLFLLVLAGCGGAPQSPVVQTTARDLTPAGDAEPTERHASGQGAGIGGGSHDGRGGRTGAGGHKHQSGRGAGTGGGNRDGSGSREGPKPAPP